MLHARFNNRAYDVVRLLATMRPLCLGGGRDHEFDALVAEIRTGHKRRTNLITRMDRARL